MELVHLPLNYEEKTAFYDGVSIENLDETLFQTSLPDNHKGLILYCIPSALMPSGKEIVAGKHKSIYFSPDTCK